MLSNKDWIWRNFETFVAEERRWCKRNVKRPQKLIFLKPFCKCKSSFLSIWMINWIREMMHIISHNLHHYFKFSSTISRLKSVVSKWFWYEVYNISPMFINWRILVSVSDQMNFRQRLMLHRLQLSPGLNL